MATRESKRGARCSANHTGHSSRLSSLPVMRFFRSHVSRFFHHCSGRGLAHQSNTTTYREPLTAHVLGCEGLFCVYGGIIVILSRRASRRQGSQPWARRKYMPHAPRTCGVRRTKTTADVWWFFCFEAFPKTSRFGEFSGSRLPTIKVKARRFSRLTSAFRGGDKGVRTPDLMTASMICWGNARKRRKLKS